MARKPNQVEPSVGDLLSNAMTFEGFSVDTAVTFNSWKPEPGTKRAFELMGFTEKQGDNGTYLIYNGRDLKTNELFSFIGGGLFDHFTREKGIVTGDWIGVQYNGTVPAPMTKGNPKGLGNVKSWSIVKLRKTE